MQKSTLDILREVINLGYINRRFVIAVFVAVNLLALAAGYGWPNKYSSYTTIYIEEKNILGPLMQGTAVQTEVIDRGRIARETIFGRQIMLKILELGGWLESNPSPLEQERIIKEIQDRTEISNVGRNLVRISYKDDIPNRAYIITKGFADLFIEGSLKAKVNESQSAFEFINQQVAEYQNKLKQSEEALKKFRLENVDFRDGAEAEVTRRIVRYRNQIEEFTQQLSEAEIKKKSLKNQLSGETETAAGLSREDQIRSRIAELQSNLDTLRLSYHETYPDIVQIKIQIKELEESLGNVDTQRNKEKKEARRKGELYIDESIRANPIYQQLQSDLYQTNTLIETLKVRIKDTEKLLNNELERDKRINSAEATLTALTRDYNVNQDVYQDLLRRRENARVSMNLDAEHQGLNLSISEPAFLPHAPSGPRFIHFILGGIILGILLPLGVLYIKQQISPRILSRNDITIKYDLPVIGELSQFVTINERNAFKKEVIFDSVLLGLITCLIVVSSILHYMSEQ